MLDFLNGKQKVVKAKADPVYNTETMIPISEIRGDTMIMKDSGLRGIIKVTGLNIDLKNSDDQVVLIEQYKKFLNSMSFPLQILVRNDYLDLTDYLQYTRGNVKSISNPILKQQGDAYVKFLEDIDNKQGLIYTKHFYIIIPYYPGKEENNEIKKAWWSKMLDVLDSKDSAEKIVARYRGFMKSRQFLDTRCSLVMDGLRALGMGVERMDMPDLVSLLFTGYNPSMHSSQSTMPDL